MSPPTVAAPPGTPLAVRGTEPSVPRHVAIIMDGNGRWAAKRGLPRVAGHRAGAEAVRKAIEVAADAGVEVLTLYAFSSENWRRSEQEVADLTGLMRFYLERELATLEREGVRVRLIGEPAAFGAELAAKLERACERTAGNERLTLVVALNYGSRTELCGAAQRLAERVAAGKLDPADIDEAVLGAELQTADLPDLDLLIRTSGEMRLSNFLLWQMSYAEIYVTKQLWPDFSREDFLDAMADFAQRERRFGAI